MVNYFLLFLPSFLSVPIRRMLGASIGKGSVISMGALLRTNNNCLVIGDGVQIKPFSFIKADKLSIGHLTMMSPFLKINLEELLIGKQVFINSFTTIVGKKVSIGDHTRIFEYCFLEAGREIKIGRKVGIGGHGLIFTHGSWSNYLEGAPVSFGEVVIEDNVWLPWRVFVLPNVTIGQNAIVGGNSLVTKSIPANSLAGGSPAKVIRENIMTVTSEIRHQRLTEVITNFTTQHKMGYSIFVDSSNEARSGDIVFFLDQEAKKDMIDALLSKDIDVIDYNKEQYYISKKTDPAFREFLTLYGVRLYYTFHD